MGFIEETGAARYWRDSRIAPIYEGTNGIQAADLVTRKLPLSNGNHVRGYITELKQVVNAVRASNLEGFGDTAPASTRASRISRTRPNGCSRSSLPAMRLQHLPVPRPTSASSASL